MKNQFLDELRAIGGKSTNKALREVLLGALPMWDLTTYNQIKQELIRDGIVVSYRCRGGGVKMTNGV